MHEKGSQRQKGARPLVSIQKRRALLVPLINRWSNVVFVSPSVDIGFRLLVLLKIRSGQVCTVPWKVRGTGVSWAKRSVGVPCCPAPPRPAAPPRAAPTRPARGMSGFWTRQVVPANPFHASHIREKTSAGTNRRRYNRQQPETNSVQRPADKPLVNVTCLFFRRRRSSTGRVCSSVGLHRFSFGRACDGSFKTVVLDALESRRA